MILTAMFLLLNVNIQNRSDNRWAMLEKYLRQYKCKMLLVNNKSKQNK